MLDRMKISGVFGNETRHDVWTLQDCSHMKMQTSAFATSVQTCEIIWFNGLEIFVDCHDFST